MKKQFDYRTLEDVKKVTLEVNNGTIIEMKRGKKITDKKDTHVKFKFWDKRKLKRSPDKSFIINMMFSNGTSKLFVIKTDGNTFSMKKKTYYLYYEESWFNLSLNQYELFYHENFSVPINREVIADGDEHYFAVTPENLKTIIKFEYIKALTGMSSIEKWIKITLILSGLTLIGVILLLLKLFQNVAK